MVDKCPRKNCNERYTACWGSCDKYKEWRKEFDAKKEEMDKHKLNYYNMQIYEMERNRRIKKKLNLKGK